MNAHTETLITAADAILSELASTGGATVDVFTGGPACHSHGFYVSLQDYGWTHAADTELPDVVQQYVNHAPEWIDRFTVADDDDDNAPLYVGAWQDTDTDTVHLDLTVWTRSLTTALWFGRANRQLAIWDIASGREIRVTEPSVSLEKRPHVSLRKRPHVRPLSPTATLGNGVSLSRKDV